MKIKNILKKDKKEVKTSSIQKVDKKQLEKVVGGSTIATPTSNDGGGYSWWGHCNA